LLAAHCEVVATVCEQGALLKEVRGRRPDLVVLDIVIAPTTGIDLIRQIREVGPAIRIVIVTIQDDPSLAAEALRAGAAAYVLKNCATSELLEAVREAMAQKTYVTPLLAGGMIRALARRTHGVMCGRPITPRQREVLRLLAEGKSMKEVAALLNLTVRTVAFHKYRMMAQQHIKSSAELVRFAVGQHIV